MSEKWKDYPKSEKYRVIGEQGVPHPYVIGSKLIVYCSDDWGGVLSGDCIKAYEKKIRKPSCEMQGCKLSFEEHKQALAIEVDDNHNEDTVSYLLSIKEKALADGYTGFCFFKSESYKEIDGKRKSKTATRKSRSGSKSRKPAVASKGRA